jgi:hypothetical protein
MKKLIFILVLLSMACTSIIPTPNEFPTPPNDFPPPPMTVIVEPTFPLPTATLEPRLRPITSADMPEAYNLLLIIKTQFAAGDYQGIAERVHYPIRLSINGQYTTYTYADELSQNLGKIMTQKVMDAILDAKEEDLAALPDGVRVGHGELWFNLYCTDLACSGSQFLITQINN